MSILTPPLSRSPSIDVDEPCGDNLDFAKGVLHGCELDGFHRLVEDLSDILDSSSGTTIADVEPTAIISRMQAYQSNRAEWSKYAFEDLSRGYTRNLVDAGKGKSNLLILVWTPGKGSPIHDHADAHCVMKEILKGKLKEDLFAWPAEGRQAPMRLTSEKTLHAEEVAYMSDQLGLHRITNPDPTEIAVSLHMYTPPNAAVHGCEIFDERTGRSSHVQGCQLYSEYGVKK